MTRRKRKRAIECGTRRRAVTKGELEFREPGFGAYERTLGPYGGRIVASAVDRTGKPVIVAVRFGKGLVVRTGLLEFASHLNGDRNAAALMEALWRNLSR